MDTALGMSLEDTHATPRHMLGYIYRAPAKDSGTDLIDAGHREYIYVKMTGGAAAAGQVLSRKTGSTKKEVVAAPVSISPMRIVGVAQWAIAQDYYGFILRKGPGEVLAGTGGITAEQTLTVNGTDAGTAASTGTATSIGYGVAVDTATATNLGTAVFNCVG